MSNKQVTIQCVVVDILESNLRCLENYKCLFEMFFTLVIYETDYQCEHFF